MVRIGANAGFRTTGRKGSQAGRILLTDITLLVPDD
jgi:hypothetical protein